MKAKKVSNWYEKEKCVSCHTETPYHVATPIDERLYYVEGVGQLCSACYDKIYNKKDD